MKTIRGAETLILPRSGLFDESGWVQPHSPYFAIFVTVKTIYLARRMARMPMVRIATGLAVGIALADVIELPVWFAAAVFVVAGSAALLLRSSALLVLLLAAAGYADARLHAEEPSVPRETVTVFAVQIEGMPADRGRYIAAEGVVTAWRDPADGSWRAARDRVAVRADSLTPLSGGERLYCRGRVRPLRGGSVSYRRLMERRGVVGTLWMTEQDILHRELARETGLHAAASRRLAAKVGTGDAGAVVRAMTVGDRSALGSQLRACYARSGMSHLLAVSGLHTGIVFLLLNLVLWWLPLVRRGHVVRNVLVIAAVWTYVAAAGFPASAVRAAVMCTLLQATLAAGSEYAALNALGAAAAGMLLWNPAWLGDIGFRLSFVAVAAILAWGVPLCRRLRTRYGALNRVVEALTIGFAASLATAPLVSHTFGMVPLAGIVLSPVVVVLAGGVVGGGVVALLVQPAAVLVRPLAEGAAEWLNAAARVVAAVPAGAVDYTLPGWATAAVYLLFAAATLAAWCAEPKKNVHLPL